jgi:hypothetical protein
MSRKPCVAIYPTRSDTSGRSFTPSSTSIAVILHGGRHVPRNDDGESPISNVRQDVTCTPAEVRQAHRSRIHNQRRRIWSIVHTVADLHRCHRPPIRLWRASDGANRAVRSSAASSCRHVLQFAANGRSAQVEFTNGMRAATIAHLAFALPWLAESTFYQDAIIAESFHLP